MKAILCTKYGSPDVLLLKEVEKPIPNNKQVLIRVYSTTVTVGDTELREIYLPKESEKIVIKLNS